LCGELTSARDSTDYLDRQA